MLGLCSSVSTSVVSLITNNSNYDRPFYELANYIVLGRILYYVPYHSPIHPGRVLTTFGAISAIVEALNGNGASYSTNSSLSESQQKMGHDLMKAALVIQLGIITSFVWLAVYFHRRCYKANLLPDNLKSILYTLYASSALIMVRTIYRTVEYFSVASIRYGPGFDPMSLSPIVRYEWFFWVFEALLMITNSVLLNVRHPAKYLPSSNKVYLAEDGVTEIMGPGYADKRNFFITFLDPFDLIGLIRGRDKKDRYWERQEEANAPAMGNDTVAVHGGKDVKT